MKKHIALFLMMAGFCMSPLGWAAGGIAIETGRGDATDLDQISLLQKWDSTWFSDGDWHLTGYWEASLGRWKASADGSKTVWDVGVTPVFRLQPKLNAGVTPYVEGAIGAHLLSNRRISATRDMGTTFQFGSHLGLGLMFGDKGRFDMGYRFQHLSNGDLGSPNPGINFHQLRFAYLF